MKLENVEDIYKLSPMQRSLLYFTSSLSATGRNFTQTSYILEGELNEPAFKGAWQRVVDRHSVLRTSFHSEGLDKPIQMVHRQAQLPLARQDWRELSSAEQRERLDALFIEDREQPFDVSHAPLMRLSLIRGADETSYLIWSHHDLILDARSADLIFGEVWRSYESLSHGPSPQREAAPPYKDYIEWLKGQDQSDAERFWRQMFTGFSPPPAQTESHRRGIATVRFDHHKKNRTQLSKSATAALRSFIGQHQLSLNVLAQAAWALFLSRCSDADEVVFGVTVSSRPRTLSGVDQMAGCFSNILPRKAQVSPGAFLLPWLRDLQAEQFKIEQHQHFALSDIHDWAGAPPDHPLVESLLVFEESAAEGPLWGRSGSLAVHRYGSSQCYSSPLVLITSLGQHLTLEISHDRQSFEEAAIVQTLGRLKMIIEEIVSHPGQRLSALPLLTPAERQQLLVEWNNTRNDYPLNKCIHEVFEARVAQSPEAMAFLNGDQSLTYRELNRRANQMAHYLSRLGVGPEVMVGIYMERTVETMIGLLSILKAGGTYVPLDPSSPSERIAHMLANARVSLVLTQMHLVLDLLMCAAPLQFVCLDSDWETIAQENGENPSPKATGENLAYVIYTSGSSGKPKGVCVAHGSAVNHFITMQREFGLTASDRDLQFASLNFDVSLEQIFPALFSGATVVQRETEIWDGAEFYRQVLRFDLTVVNLPPVYWSRLTQGDVCQLEPAHDTRLRLMIVGGDTVSPEAVRRWQQTGMKKVRLLNAYGPTETVITASTHEIPDRYFENRATSRVPIGRPLANRTMYVLNKRGHPAPIGVWGQLHIGGPLLARCYLDEPELTAEKFIPNEFCHEPGERLYRSGDVCRYLPDGNLEFRGRVDFQVKVRGFRIELGEIESFLNQHPGVRESVVIAREDPVADKQLVAYVVAGPEHSLSTAELRGYLKEKLPDYMVPSWFVMLDALPVTVNGKVDRDALPAHDSKQTAPERFYVPTRNPIETGLTAVWEEVLGVERVGITENFFELGGHSLLATQVISRVRDRFGVELPLRVVFEAPTVAELATAIVLKQAEQGDQDDVATILAEIERLSNTEAQILYADVER